MRKARIRLACLAAVAAALSPMHAEAVDYTLDGSLRYDANHDDNLQLSGQPKSSLGQTASTRIELGAAGERTTANLDTQLWARRYNRSGFDSDDQTMRADVAHTFELSSIGLGLSAVRDSTLTSELLDSGRISAAQRHEQYSASPRWSYQLSEQDLISLQGSYASSHYSGDGYTDYTYWQTQLLWTHTISERLRGFFSVSYSDYQAQPTLFAFDQSYATASIDRGAQIGGDYQFSEKIVASLLAGVTRNHNDVQVNDPLGFCPIVVGTFLQAQFPLCALQDSDSSLTTLNGSLRWTGLRNILSLDISRSTQPSSDGYVQQTDQLNLIWNYRIWENGTLGLTVNAGTSDAPDARSARNGALSRDYAYTTLSYTHSLSEHWLIDCNYQYRTQQYESQPRVDSNVAFVGITWKPETQHWSR